MHGSHLPIDLHNVAKQFGRTHALRDASFRIEAGEHACLLGPNGAGKTTIIRLLTGALLPSTGVVRVWGCATDDHDFLRAKRRMGVVPQTPGMYRDLKVRAYLHLVRDLYGAGDIAAVVLAFGLVPYVDQPLGALSGGVARRVLLAGAVLPKPDLLLLDEPTVGLDPVAARDVHAYLEHAMNGRTMLLCTHNLPEAEALCRSVVMVQAGRVLLHEGIATLRQRMQPRLRLQATEGSASLAHALEQLGCAPMVADDHVLLPIADPERDAPQLLRRLLGINLNVYACQVLAPSLEDLFMHIVGGADARA
jgi:ABC-2 type transport system ATP-binding protein